MRRFAGEEYTCKGGIINKPNNKLDVTPPWVKSGIHNVL